MENVPGKSFEDRGFGRLLYRADDSISGLIRVSGTGARSPPNAACRRDGTSDGGMDGAATAGSISMGQRAAFLATRPRPNLRCRFHEASGRTGDSVLCHFGRVKFGSLKLRRVRVVSGL